MKNALLFFLLCLTSIIAAQNRQDTVFSAPGVISNVKHYSKMDVTSMSKADLFMRGLTFGDEVWQIDSISVFDANGKFIRTRPIEELDRPQRSNETFQQREARLSKEKELANPKYAKLYWPDRLAFSGYAGTRETKTFDIRIRVEAGMSLRPADLPPNMSLSGLEQPLAEGEHKLTLNVLLAPGISQQTIRLSGPAGEAYDLHVAMQGYDLTEADFVSISNEASLKQLDAREREHLYLRLHSTEKLLNIYQGDQLRYHCPVGRQLDQLAVYQLPAGNYRMEIIDLGTGEKRSYGLLR